MYKFKACLLLSALVFFSNVALANTAANTPSQAEPSAQLELVIEQININTADVTTLTKLKGVGVKKAEAIVAWRQAHGDFKNVEQIMDVKGIGSAIFEANRGNLSI